MRVYFFLLSALVFAGPAQASDYRIPAASSPIEIDGSLDEAAWSQALTFTLDNEFEPGRNVPAPVTAVAYLTHDDDRLYVGFRAYDPDPSAIRAHLTDRDTALRDDYVGIVLDTFNDERGGYELFVNPLGVQMDLALNETTGSQATEEDAAWDAIWDSAGRIDEQGYVVEMAVPFSSLRFQRSSAEQTWGIAAVRSYPRSARHQITMVPLAPDDPCLVCQIPKVTGFGGATPGRNVELDPTATARRTDRREAFPLGPLDSGEAETDLGLTARWGITPNLILSGAVNPDFSHVEADIAQLEVNRQFTLFFPEKRPFFLEGAGFFDTPFGVVYTRSVADPAWGVKMTGKEGANGIGLFVVRDDVTNLLLPGPQSSLFASLDAEATAAALRYRRDLGPSANLGVVATHREGGSYRSTLYGVDGLWRPNLSDQVSVQFLDSRSQYPEEIADGSFQPAGAFDGSAARLAYNHNSRKWTWFGVYEDVDPGFRADLGFLPRVGYTFLAGRAERLWWGEPGDRYTRFSLGGDWNVYEGPGGRQIDRQMQGWVTVLGPLQSYAQLMWVERDLVWNGIPFEERGPYLFFEIRPSGRLELRLQSFYGDTVDFAGSRPAETLRIAPSVRYDFGRHLRMSLSLDRQWFDTRDGEPLIDATLAELRSVYQLNVRTFVRAIVQLSDVERAGSTQEHVFTQLLFSYKLNPQTVLFVGYSDNHLGFPAVDLTQADRTFFLKLGYALVM